MVYFKSMPSRSRSTGPQLVAGWALAGGRVAAGGNPGPRGWAIARHVTRQHTSDARQPLMCANWAAGVDRQFRGLGMGSSFVSSGIGALDSLSFMSRSAKRRERVWKNLHVSPRTAPSKGAKLCTYHHWFGRPTSLRFEPYHELPMGISKLRALVQLRLGSHTQLIEQGRFARPALISMRAEPNFPACSKMLRGACVCSCGTKDQKSVCHCLVAFLQKAQT